MPYRANVRVHLLNKDTTTSQQVVVARKDMDFTVLVNEPSEIGPLAREEFARVHGPDLVVRTCNLENRTSAILYGMPAAHLPKNMAAKDLPFTRPLPAQRR